MWSGQYRSPAGRRARRQARQCTQQDMFVNRSRRPDSRFGLLYWITLFGDGQDRSHHQGRAESLQQRASGTYRATRGQNVIYQYEIRPLQVRQPATKSAASRPQQPVITSRGSRSARPGQCGLGHARSLAERLADLKPQPPGHGIGQQPSVVHPSIPPSPSRHGHRNHLPGRSPKRWQIPSPDRPPRLMGQQSPQGLGQLPSPPVLERSNRLRQTITERAKADDPIKGRPVPPTTAAAGPRQFTAAH